MLDLMRRHAKSWFINVIIALIAVVFVFWGVGSFRQRDLSKVAVVNGQPISPGEFQESYRRLWEQVQQQYQGMLSDELIEALNLKRQAMDQLVNEYLIYQQARKLGLGVDDETLKAEISQTPWFQVDGRFDMQRYQTMLARLRMTHEEYEDMVRKGQAGQKVVRLVSSLALVSPDEVRDYFHWLQDEANLEFAALSPDSYQDKVEPTEDELSAYFEKNKENYRIQPQVKVEYLAFKPADFEKEINISDDEIGDYYELHLDGYRVPEQVKASHILINVPEGASPEEEAAARAKAATVLKEVRSSEAVSFAEMARKYSEGPTREEGGSLGWFAEDQMVKPFSDAAFAMKKGEISDLVRSQFGFHIIWLEDRKPAHTQPLEEVRDEISRQLVKDKASEMAVDRAETAYEEISLSQDFAATSMDLGLTPQETPWFKEDTPVTAAGSDLKFNKVALSLDKGQIGPLVEIGDNYYVVQCLDRKESYLPELAEVRGQALQDLRDQQAADQARQAAEKLLAEIKEGADWKEAAEAAGAALGETGNFTRQGLIPKIGSNDDLAQAAFDLKTPGETADQVFKGDNGYYLVRLKEKTPASDEAFEKDREKLSNSVRRAKGQEYFQLWLTDVKESSEITIEDGVL